MKALSRRQDPPPACDCAARLAALEADIAALARALAALRPGMAHHSVATALGGWGVRPGDAARIERACQHGGT